MLASLNNKNANENANEKAARRSAGRLILFWLFVFACVRCSVYKLLQLRKDENVNYVHVLTSTTQLDMLLHHLTSGAVKILVIPIVKHVGGGFFYVFF